MSAARRVRAAGIALFVLSAIIAGAVLEGGTRLWISHFASLEQLRKYGTLEQNRARDESPVLTAFAYTPHRYLGFVPTPGFERGMNRHNKLGYRGGELALRKPAGQYRIACIGGSTTYTDFVEDWHKSYPAQLEQILHENGLPQVRVINAGVAGWSSFESVVNYCLRLSEVEPDLLLIYDNFNDMVGRMVWPPSAYRADNSGHFAPMPTFPDAPLYLRSDFLRTLLIAAGRADSAMMLSQTHGRRASTSLYWRYMAQAADGRYPAGFFAEHPLEEIFAVNPPVYFERNLERLIRLAKSEGRDAALLTFKISHETNMAYNHPAIYAALDEQNEVIKSVAAREGVPVYDFAPLFSDDPKYFSDAIHVNEAGARLQAEIVAKLLLDGGLAEKVKTATAAPAVK